MPFLGELADGMAEAMDVLREDIAAAMDEPSVQARCIGAGTGLASGRIGAGTGLTPATSALGLGSPPAASGTDGAQLLPHLHGGLTRFRQTISKLHGHVFSFIDGSSAILPYPRCAPRRIEASSASLYLCRALWRDFALCGTPL
jgi:hypothetical protein